MIAIFGDSVAVGHVDKKGGWPCRLKQFFNTLYINKKINNSLSVHNFSISGANTNYLIDRFFKEIKHLEWGQPRVIIFALGKNDSAYNFESKSNEIPVKKFKKNLETMINTCFEYKDTKILLLNIGNFNDEITYPVPWDVSIGYSRELIKPYNDVLKDLSTIPNVELIDLNSKLTLEDLYDGVHPNSNGHKKIYEEVLEKIMLYFYPEYER